MEGSVCNSIAMVPAPPFMLLSGGVTSIGVTLSALCVHSGLGAGLSFIIRPPTRSSMLLS